MGIQKKPLTECSNIRIDLCGESKKIVYDFQKEYKNKTGRFIGQGLAIIKLILQAYGKDKNI